MVMPLASLFALPIALLTPAYAAPQAGFTLGGVVSHGEDSGTPYTSYAPLGTLSTTWRLGPFEAPVGVALSGLVVSNSREARPGMPLQLEAGFGIGTPEIAVGVYTSGGIGQTAGGLYGRWLFAEDDDIAYGVEARAFSLLPSGDYGFALLARLEVGDFGRRAARPAPPSGPVITATPRDDVEIPGQDEGDEDEEDEEDDSAEGSDTIHHDDPY